MNKTFLLLGLVLVGLAVAVLFYVPLGPKSSTDSGAMLSVGSVSGNPGAAVNLPISFTSGTTGVSALQFDLAIPPNLTYSSITAGSSASSADKSVQANQIGSNLRVIVFGLNQNIISFGQIAVIKFNIDSKIPAGNKTVALSGMTASNPSGVAVGISGTNGGIMIP